MSMILSDYERYIVECEIEINSTPEDAPNISMDDIIPFIKNIKPGDVYLRNNETSSFSVTETKYLDDDERYFAILFQHANGRASDPAFAELRTAKSRTVKKGLGEGVAISCHLIIDTKPFSSLYPNKYSAILEEVPGLTKGMLADILTYFLRENTNFSFLRKLENNKEIGYRPILKIDYLASHSFAESFKTGYLCGITATKSSKNTSELDEIGAEVIHEERLVIKTPKSVRNKALNVIAKVIPIAKEQGFSRLRISRYENKRKTTTSYDIPDNIGTYDETVKSISETQFASREKINLGTQIETCQNCIHTELSSKMLKILEKMKEE